MIQHADIWRGVDRLAEKHGLSASRLAKLAGLDATAFNKSKRISKDGRLRWPSTESLACALSAVGEQFSDFAALIDGAPGIALPALAFRPESASSHFDAQGHPVGPGWETIRVPMLEVSEGAYVLEVLDSSLQPKYRSGERLIISPSAQIRSGDQVLLMGTTGVLQTQTLQRRTDSHFTFQSEASGAESRTKAATEFAWIARILWVSQ